MAKARSRRTMRNRKSRNRRGGLFGRSIEEKFKNDVKKLIQFHELKDKTKTGETEYQFDEPGYTSNFQLIYDYWRKIPEEQKKSVAAYFVKTPNSYRRTDYERIIKDLEKTDSKLKNPLYSVSVLLPPSAEKKENPSVEEPPSVEEEEKQIRTSISFGSPGYPSSGGKSRRRHRRGRTLHKIRKSRKVRKTRCRRGRK